jgi:hypothetical protein
MTQPARPLRVVPGPRPPGPVPADGAAVLDEIGAFVSRFNIFPSEHCVPMLVLWYAHTHAAEHFYITPRLILSSAEPGSGKTRVLEVAQYLVATPEMTMSASPAALFRLISAAPITILFDEVDAIFSPKNNGGNIEDLRALLNAGYKRSATIPRCVGDAKAMKVQRFKVYAPAALAGIAGHMPDTITTRAITVHMKRRAPNEKVAPFKTRKVEAEAEPLRDRLATWVASIGERVGEAEPEMPDGVTDRSAEIWEPLLAIADEAGGHWPDKARAACSHFVANTDPRAGSIGLRLLADLREIFTEHQAERLPTTAILDALHAMEERSWADFFGKPFDARNLSKELGRYGVQIRPFKLNGATTKGYQTTGETGLADAWTRYLPPPAANPE